MTTSDIDSISVYLGIITGIVFLIVYMILSYFFRKKALHKIENNLQEGEYIVKEPQTNFTVDALMPLCTGGFVGMYILPFFIYPGIKYIDSPYTGSINRECLPLCIIIILIAIFFTVHVSAMNCAFTNKRIINASAFEVFNRFLPFNHINYSDIKDYKYENVLKIQTLTVLTKTNKKFTISGLKNLKKFISIIEKYR